MAEHFTTEQVIKAIKEKKGIVSSVADTLGVSRLTVYNYINRHATVQQALQDERERMIDTAESALYVALSKQEAWAVSLVLKTIGKNRGYVERIENNISGEVTTYVVDIGTSQTTENAGATALLVNPTAEDILDEPG
jgi:predicted transcriptional regulator